MTFIILSKKLNSFEKLWLSRILITLDTLLNLCQIQSPELAALLSRSLMALPKLLSGNSSV